MRFLKVLAIPSLILMATSFPARADSFSLYEWAVNIDGSISDYKLPALPGFPAGVNVAGFDQATGLGAVRIAVNGAGAHSVLAFFDIEIDEAINTYYNELGSVTGLAPAGLTFEVDEPGFVFGDIYTHFIANALDGSVLAGPEDISVAFGWNVLLKADETAYLTFHVTTDRPGGGFYLQQTDPDSAKDIYFTTDAVIRGGGPPIPEPSSIVLLATVAAGLGIARFRKARA